MSFGLLTPLFLMGLAALAIPVLVHLVRREEQVSFAFPSLMFLERIPTREHRQRTIRHWWLLALRCLIVALLCLAFAQPFIAWPTDIAAGLGESRDRVVLLDRSHSMQAGSRFEEARRLAREAIDELAAGDRAALVLFDHDTLIKQRLTQDRAELRAALAAARTGDGHTDINRALARANALLANSRAAIREIVLVSDFQRSGAGAGERARLAPGIDLLPRPVTGAEEANAAVAAVQLVHEPLGEGDAVELSARIVNTSAFPIDGTDVAMEVDGQDRERRKLSLAPGESRDVKFRVVLAPNERLQVRIHIGDDALAADNSYHILVSGPAAVSVLLVEARGARPEKSLHLEQALRQGDAPGFRITSRLASQLRASDIDAADVVVIDNAPIPGGETGAHLEKFLRSGGGLLVVAAGRAQGSWPNGEDGIVPGRLGPPVNRSDTDPARILGMNTLHPALATFAGNDAGGLSSAQVFRYRKLTGVEDTAVLARYDDESVALAEREVGRGRVLVLTTTLDPSWNTLALQPGYLPFVHEALKFLASHVATTEAFAVGDTVDLAAYARSLPGHTQTAAALARGSVTTMRTPSGREIRMPPGEAFARAQEAGFHEVHVSGGGARSLLFAANALARESDLTPLDANAFAAAIGRAGGAQAAASAKGPGPAHTTTHRRIWVFLLVACALLLALETLISNRLSRSMRVS